MPKHFILHLDHKALSHINGQYELNTRHVKGLEFLQSFTFSLKHNSWKKNVVVDVLLKRFPLYQLLNLKSLVSIPYSFIQGG